jgi:hypothetical protein
LRTNRMVAGLGVVSALSLGLTGLGHGVADASTSLKSVTITMNAKSITLSSGSSLHAGRYIFKVVEPNGDDSIQLVTLARGYSVAQAKSDINSAFGGKVSAVRTIDKKIHWFGGVEASTRHPGYFAETLYAGTYYLTEQGGNAITTLHVYGTPPGGQGWVNQTSTLGAVKPNRFAVPATIARTGWTMFRNTAAEPHFIEFQQVKPETTYREVLAALKSNAQTPPSWALPGSYGTAVISPNTQMLFHYSLPAGKYVMMCFWPDDETGMPHAVMGMYKFITLK